MTCPTCKDWGLDGQKFSIAIVELLWIGVDVNVDSGETLAEGVRFSSGVSELFSTSEDSTGKKMHYNLIDRPLYIYKAENFTYTLSIKKYTIFDVSRYE